MNEEHIVKVQALLTEWNPLGSQSAQISDLNNYEIEATDILFHIKKNNTVDQISKMITTVLNQAFGIHVEPVKCKIIAEQVQIMLKEK
ncbi:DUF1871 family protein [Flagellimonas pacifica]|uniref:DUF1871 family protein n=1 Tax=Flagellimonas pacifica TaxID=1247520 RepID=A0A285MYV7_9FLAO|nr:DUF1871 family protein [Allomuricauda parva]SNZ00976.1 protein of unknown function [Allomuricauda parva]